MRAHGVRSTFSHGGCRCDECRDAERRYRVKRRAGLTVAPHIRAQQRLAQATRESWSWVEDAACRGMNADLFFTAGTSRGEQYLDARKVCATCPVTAECLAYSEASAETREHGMWGGMSPEERRKARKRKRIT